MRGLKRLGLVLASMVVFGVMASSALAALPDIHIALGEAFPVTATGECSKCTTELNTAGGSVLKGTGVKTTIECTVLSSLCKYSAFFLNVTFLTKKCKADGDTAGNVLILGEVHAVFVQLTPALLIGALFLVPKQKIECEGVNITVEGSVLSTFKATLNGDISSFTGALLGSKGKQALTKYFNEAGTEVSAELLEEAGSGFTKAAQNVSEEITFKTNKMIEILG